MHRFAILLATLLPAGSALASGTRTWELSRYGDFLTGTFETVALDREGSLRAAPAVEELYKSDQAVVWAIARAADGAVYVGTGHQGSVFRVTEDGGELLWKAPEPEVFALAIGPEGRLYAGTAPDGKVYRIAADGSAEEFFDPGEKYIWALLFDAKGRLVVGTGDGGKLYRITPEGEGEAWLESGQRHVMSLALDRNGDLLAGTDPEGILYRVDETGTAFALHDSDLPEVRSVAVGSDGAVYFGAMGGGMDRILQAIPAQAAAVTAQAATAAGANVAVAQPQVASTVSFAQPQVVYSGERSALLRLREGQAIEKLWTSNEEHILGIALPDGEGSRALFATDREGRMYRTDSDRRLSLVAQTGHPQITVLLPAPDGIFLGAAHGGSLYRLAAAPAPQGTYESAPHDTGGVSRWGRLSWRGDAPDGARIEIRTRSGNAYRPDQSWSAWSEPLGEREGAAIASPAARFLQWRAILRGAARLDSVRVRYLPQNSAPVVRSVNVVPETAKASQNSAPKPANSSSSYSITVSASGSVSPPQSGSASAASTPDSPLRKLAIVWSAEDADGDKLSAEVSFRGLGESAWKTIEKDLPGPRHSIESDTLADGRYEFRVRVDDGAANPAERALSAERISRPVLVDQTPPRLRPLPDGPGGEARFEAEDDLSEIRSAEYAVNAGDWRPVLSEDGILDARRETFALRLDGLPEGERLVVLRVRDWAGNAALAKTLRP